MFIRPMFVLLLLGIVLVNVSDGLFIKAKIIAAKKPLLLAKAAVAKEVALKAKIAAKTTSAAAKATAVAVKSAALAPIKIAKKTIGIKVAALKAAKAYKIAKINDLLQTQSAGVGTTQIVLPRGAVAVLPISSLSGVNFPLVAHPVQHNAVSNFALPLKSFITQSLSQGISEFGSNFTPRPDRPFVGASISTVFANSQNTLNAASHQSQHNPVYSFVPVSGLSHTHKVSYAPLQVDINLQEKPTILEPHQSYGPPS